MTYPNQPKDPGGIPIAAAYVPGVGFVPLQGSTLINTDASMGNNLSTAARMELVGGSKATYSATISIFTPGASAQDFFTLTGSSTKLVKVTKALVSYSTTNVATASATDLMLAKRSSANSTGTTVTATPYDSADASATALAQSYAANPTTTGTFVGFLGGQRLMPIASPLTATDFPSSPGVAVWEFGTRPAKPPMLRSNAEVFALNLNGNTLAATAFITAFIEWTEE